MEYLPNWKYATKVSIDTETCDPYLKNTKRDLNLGSNAQRPENFLVGISFCLNDNKPYYLPIAHEAGGNLDQDKVIEYLKDQFKEFKGEVIGANLPYDLDWLLEYGITFPGVTYFRDVQIADALIYNLHSSYSLENIAKRYKFKGKEEDQLIAACDKYGLVERRTVTKKDKEGNKIQKVKISYKHNIWKLHSKYVEAYAREDARLPLEIIKKQEQIIKEHKLQDIYDLESDVLWALLSMKRKGIKIDLEQLEQLESWTTKTERSLLESIYKETKIEIPFDGIWKKSNIVPIFDSLNIKYGYTPAGQPKLDSSVFANPKHPVVAQIAQVRKVNKLRTTFAKSIKRYMVAGRLYPNYNQLASDDGKDGVMGAKYGRLSSCHPNIQQQPSRDEFAKAWRSIYIPEPGARWGSFDYSQQEPRMTIHYAVLCGLTGANEAAQAYIDDINNDNHTMMAKMAGIGRKAAKTIFLGLCYGMGGGKMCRQLGLPTKKKIIFTGELKEVAGIEGQQLLDTFKNKVPFVPQLSKICKNKALKNGYIRTLLGRRCYFPEGVNGYQDAHKALNRLIQGSSADQAKLALVLISKANYSLQLQVHDEVGCSIYSDKEAKEIKDIMEHCVNLNVPSKVDVELGKSWGDSMS